MAAQQPVGDGVERAGVDPAGRARVGQRAHPADHLVGGPPGERDEQDPLRWDACRHEPGQA